MPGMYFTASISMLGMDFVVIEIPFKNQFTSSLRFSLKRQKLNMATSYSLTIEPSLRRKNSSKTVWERRVWHASNSGKPSAILIFLLAWDRRMVRSMADGVVVSVSKKFILMCNLNKSKLDDTILTGPKHYMSQKER